ncbi:hypothetical protein JRO89_XS04G0049100 [Xanthoceras sorbifolium]|uniref:Seipin n=1 Tax=Xanthoceras sorbifolium TaxID=99658 RepID=A0ABQ8I493_9ROSI|nr:hypothetical protein JRO89_XS04G0049100 [Xanthoceras sorbifolium]
MTPHFSPISPDPPPMKEENEEEEEEENNQLILKPAEWFPKLLSLQADIIYNCILILISPILSLLSVASNSYHRAEETAAAVETAVQNVPSKITHGSGLILKKVGLGCLGAIQVIVVLIVLVAVAAALGVGLVNMWVEEPVFVREKLFFDYTNENPEAVFQVGGGDSFGGKFMMVSNKKRKHSSMGVPIGHTYQVCVVLLMPESDFNREIGVFQLTAELLSINGDVIAKSSQPCMLHFRSSLLRLTRTVLMGIPLLLGVSDETQKITIKILRHKEGNRRTEAIRVILSPRAGSSRLPQLYEAEIILNSRLPWTKEFVHNWKWTFYVWSSFYIYIILLTTLTCCCRPFWYPVTASGNSHGGRMIDGRISNPTGQESREAARWSRYEKGASESMRKWQLSRRKRKAIFLQERVPEAEASSASSSVRVSGEETSTFVEEDIGDSESV